MQRIKRSGEAAINTVGTEKKIEYLNQHAGNFMVRHRREMPSEHMEDKVLARI